MVIMVLIAMLIILLIMILITGTVHERIVIVLFSPRTWGQRL